MTSYFFKFYYMQLVGNIKIETKFFINKIHIYIVLT